MDILTKSTRLGTLYINKDNFSMLLKYKGRIVSSQNEIYDIFASNKIPLKVQLELTGKCNLNCYYCYARSIRVHSGLKLDEIKKMIDILADIGIVFVELTGGEPLVRKDFVEILQYLNYKGFIINLFTNAAMLNEKIIYELKKCKITIINTSLLAPNEELCDRLTGVPGSFKAIISGIELLKQNDLPFRVNVSITSENVKYYEEFVKLSEKLGVEFSFVPDVIPTFEGFKDVKKYSLKGEEIKYLGRYLKKTLPGICTAIKNYKCDAGSSKFAVDALGDVFPCLKYRKKIGNILEESFWDNWISNKFHSNSEYFKRESECKECPKKSYCFYCPGVIQMYNEDNHLKCKKAELLYSISQT